MKSYLLLLVLVLGLGSLVHAQEAKVTQPSGYVINGTINGDYKGKVYLVREEALHGAQTVIDSTRREVSFRGGQRRGGDVAFHQERGRAADSAVSGKRHD